MLSSLGRKPPALLVLFHPDRPCLGFFQSFPEAFTIIFDAEEGIKRLYRLIAGLKPDSGDASFIYIHSFNLFYHFGADRPVVIGKGIPYIDSIHIIPTLFGRKIVLIGS